MINRDDSLLFAAEKRAREKRAQQSLDNPAQRLAKQGDPTHSQTGDQDQRTETDAAQPLRAKHRSARG